MTLVSTNLVVARSRPDDPAGELNRLVTLCG
jgi:hypothetical protein